jgi:ligand-binding SRPBCC domain-containing protein
LWRHEHRFAQRDGGTAIADYVDYCVWGGSVVNALFVRRDVRAIFDYRSRTLIELFGAAKHG